MLGRVGISEFGAEQHNLRRVIELNRRGCDKMIGWYIGIQGLESTYGAADSFVVR
jgi:hypothetical protein